MLKHVVDILNVGLAGLAFLLAFMGYRLLAASGASLNAIRLKAMVRYLLVCAGLLIIVGAFAAFSQYQRQSDPSEVLKPCRDSLDRLQTQAGDPQLTPAQLRSVMTVHVSTCAESLRQVNVQ